MGLLKKIFKPISKVLDKVVPNEIKPFLPYAAAFAPVIAPGIMGAFGNSMLGRAAMGGGLNILGQLSQEGNEGDINLLSAGLGALTGAMTGPNAADQFKNMQTYGGRTIADIGEGTIAAEATGLEALKNKGLGFLSEGSKMFAAGMDKPFSMAGLKAAALPAAQATGDLMFAQAKRDQDEYDRMMEEESEADAASDAQRAFAIRRAMEAQGATEEEIEDAIYAAGYKTGGRVGLFSGGSPIKELGLDEDYVREIRIQWIEAGKPGRFSEFLRNELDRQAELSDEMKSQMANGGRVGFRFGGIDKAIENVTEEIETKGKEGIMQASREDPLLVEEYNKYVFDLLENRPYAKPMSFQEFKRMIKAGMKDGGRINFDEGGISLDEQQMEIIKGGGPKIVGLLAEADKMMGTEGDRLEMALEMLLRDNKDNELLKYMLDTAEERGTTKLDVLMDLIKSLRIQDIMAFDEGKKSVVDKISVKDLARKEGSMKDGGLMDLGGKEMDLRGGGFVPIGKKERADDVPARLSKNEFVMTADAVRAAGGGSVNKGAKRMYDLMNNLEARA